MSNPIGYYTSVMPGDGSVLAYLQDKYGSYFEGISRAEKLVLVQGVTNSLMDVFPRVEEDGDDAEEITELIKLHVTSRYLPGLLEALANQINS